MSRSSISPGAMFRASFKGNPPGTTEKFDPKNAFPHPKIKFDDPLTLRGDNPRLPQYEDLRLKDRTPFLIGADGRKVVGKEMASIPFAGHDERAALASEKLRGWQASEPKMQSPGGSGWHKLVEAYESGKVFSVWPEGEPAFTLEAYIGDPPHIFVVEHDWGAAFDGATDIEGGEYHLPYEHCAFEFRINGVRTIMSAIDMTDEKGRFGSAMIFMEGSDGYWLCGTMGDYKVMDGAGGGDNIASVAHMIAKNIRALCIGLDAEVIVRDVVRAPVKLNQARERSHKVPLPDHSVVRLAHRSRVAPLAPSSDDPKWHPRLHFVRGHWRHYDNHKTWVRWHLRGDPDLGFIDKHYRA